MISSGPVENRLAIRELVESYNDAVMRFDGDAWAENWCDDAIRELPGAGPVSGKDNFLPVWQQATSGFSFVGFFASAGPNIVNGDTATGNCDQQEFLHQKDGVKHVITGKYTDDYLKVEDRWYFQKRICEIISAEETSI